MWNTFYKCILYTRLELHDNGKFNVDNNTDRLYLNNHTVKYVYPNIQFGDLLKIQKKVQYIRT